MQQERQEHPVIAEARRHLLGRPAKPAGDDQQPPENPKPVGYYNPLGWVEVAQQEGAPIRA